MGLSRAIVNPVGPNHSPFLWILLHIMILLIIYIIALIPMAITGIIFNIDSHEYGGILHVIWTAILIYFVHFVWKPFREI